MNLYKNGTLVNSNLPASIYVRNHSSEGDIFRVVKQVEDLHYVFAFLNIGLVVFACRPDTVLPFKAKRIRKINDVLANRIADFAGSELDEYIQLVNSH